MAKMKFHKEHPELDANIQHLKMSTSSRLWELRKSHNNYKLMLSISIIVNIILVLKIAIL